MSTTSSLTSRLAFGLVVVAGAAVAFTGVSPSAVAAARARTVQNAAVQDPTAGKPTPGKLPDTGPGRLMAEWLALCDAPDLDRMTRWHQDHLAKEALKHGGAKAAAAKDVAKCEASGGYLVTQVEQDGPSRLSVFAVARTSQVRSRLALTLDGDGRIAAAQPEAPVSRAGAAVGPDVTGSWSGTAVLEMASGDTRLVRLEAELRAEGGRLSGSVSLSPAPSPSAPGQLALTSGAVAGNRLLFSAERNVVVYLFDLAIVSADRLEGTMTADSHGDEQASGRVTFIRAH